MVIGKGLLKRKNKVPFQDVILSFSIEENYGEKNPWILYVDHNFLWDSTWCQSTILGCFLKARSLETFQSLHDHLCIIYLHLSWWNSIHTWGFGVSRYIFSRVMNILSSFPPYFFDELSPFLLLPFQGCFQTWPLCFFCY